MPVQVDNDMVTPFYSYLAKQFVFADHRFGLGSNSTSGHMLAIGGQTPTMKNPPVVGATPVWDLPSIFTAADAAGGGVSGAAFPDSSGYPTKFYTGLSTAPGNANVHRPAEFIPMATAGTLPQICYVWSPAGYDEHPPATSDPAYIAKGHDLVWARVQAVIDGGGWDDTTFILTLDDRGGYADHLPTPAVETVPDTLHPAGFQAIGGSRIPLIMFGGKVTQGIDSQWHSHASIPKNDHRPARPARPWRAPRRPSPSLASHLDATVSRPLPPAHGTTITQPTPPSATPTAVPPAPWPGPTGQPMPALVTLDGSDLSAPTDGLVRANPPKPPPGPHPTPTPTPVPGPGGSNLDDLVDKKYTGKTAAELAAAPLDALKGLTAAKAEMLTHALGVTTIADLANHKIIQAATTITEHTHP